MTKELALVPLEHEMTVYDTIANKAVSSKFYKNLGDSSAVMTLMLSARELGISPMAAINGGLNIIQGKVEISARMMNALIRRGGHSIKTLECTNEKCRLKGKRRDNGDEEEVSFSIEDAKQAGLVRSGGGWTKWTSDMLYARALSRLARRLFPDVIGCAYVEGEIAAPEPKEEVLEEAEIVEMEPMKLMEEFTDEEKPHLEEYIKQVHEKFGIGYEEINNKYYDSPDAFREKFKIWQARHSVISS